MRESVAERSLTFGGDDVPSMTRPADTLPLFRGSWILNHEGREGTQSRVLY